MPCLLYRLECYTSPKSSLKSLDFVVVRFLVKLFKTVNNEIIPECCSYFKFTLPSELLDNQRVKFQNNFMLCTGILILIVVGTCPRRYVPASVCRGKAACRGEAAALRATRRSRGLATRHSGGHS